MPELPEVETVLRGLSSDLVGRTITGIEIFKPLVLKTSRQKFLSALSGKTVSSVTRHGKALFWTLGDGSIVRVHLGMTGALLFQGKTTADPYVRIRFRLDDPKQDLVYRDVRQFGRINLADIAQEKNWGPDAWASSLKIIFAALRKKNGMIKHALMNQTVIAGLGNIYVDECLFAAGIHPKKKMEKLKDETLRRLSVVIKDVLKRAIHARGTSFRDYVNTAGEQGNFKGLLKVYGQKGKPCVVCGTPIKKIVVASRGTHYCLICQKK